MEELYHVLRRKRSFIILFKEKVEACIFFFKCWAYYAYNLVLKRVIPFHNIIWMIRYSHYLLSNKPPHNLMASNNSNYLLWPWIWSLGKTWQEQHVPVMSSGTGLLWAGRVTSKVVHSQAAKPAGSTRLWIRASLSLQRGLPKVAWASLQYSRRNPRMRS